MVVVPVVPLKDLRKTCPRRAYNPDPDEPVVVAPPIPRLEAASAANAASAAPVAAASVAARWTRLPAETPPPPPPPAEEGEVEDEVHSMAAIVVHGLPFVLPPASRSDNTPSSPAMSATS